MVKLPMYSLPVCNTPRLITCLASACERDTVSAGRPGHHRPVREEKVGVEWGFTFAEAAAAAWLPKEGLSRRDLAGAGDESENRRALMSESESSGSPRLRRGKVRVKHESESRRPS